MGGREDIGPVRMVVSNCSDILSISGPKAMRLADSHLHLHDVRMSAIADAALVRAREASVALFILAGVDEQTWAHQDALAARHPDVWVTYGIHPQIVAEQSDLALDGELRALEQKLITHPCCGVGEIGLDAYTKERKATLPRQERAFVAQLRLAKKFDLPVALHILAAHPAALAVLRQEGVPQRGGVVHSYSGSAELAREYVELGLHLSFAGTITNPSAKRARAACAVVPEDRFLIETDSPDQTPVARRPLRNEPAFLIDIAEAAAGLRGVSVGELAEQSWANTLRLFQGSQSSLSAAK